ncbi:hypothetical protein KIPB_010245, partial [Kipferlia bialata]|eukprot:g10245.t1
MSHNEMRDAQADPQFQT